MTETANAHPALWTGLRRESGLAFGVVTLALLLMVGEAGLSAIAGDWTQPLLFCWLFSSMLWLSFSVVHHADCLAIRLGEPYGTLVLTLSVISIEVVMISAVMLTGGENPELGRDMMFAVLMIVLNGLVGLSLLLGGLRHTEQSYNLQGANSFLMVLLPLGALTFILPNHTNATAVGTYSSGQMFFAMMAAAFLYGAFLFAQTARHKGYFRLGGDLEHDAAHDEDLGVRSVGFHALLLLANLLPIILLSKSMARVIEHGTNALGAPVAIGGLIIAVLVLAPEGMAAVKAAIHDRLQRSINICLGSAVATIGMTVPAVLLIGLVTGKTVVLGLGPVDSVLLLTTAAVSVVTFSGRQTNAIHGTVHLILFLAYIIMLFDGV